MYDKVTCNYDALAREVVCVDQKGQKVEKVFDLAGRMTARKYYNADKTLESTDSFTYDKESKMLTATKGRYNNKVSLTYDPRGLVTNENLTYNISGNADNSSDTYYISHNYDSDNRRTQTINSTYSIKDIQYTPRDQISQISFRRWSRAAKHDISFAYDNGGRETSRTYSNGMVETRAYRLDNQLSSISNRNYSLSYGYDANKNVISEDGARLFRNKGFRASFDAQDRLVGYTSQRDRTKSFTQKLSAIGNRNSITQNNVTDRRTYGNTHQLLTGGNKAYSYNVKGEQTSRNGNKLVYDIDGHLANVVREDGTNVAGYTYDALGRRIAKKTYNDEEELEEERRFIYQGQRVLDEYARSSETADFTIKRRYIYGNYIDEVILAVHDLYTIVNYHSDRQYNVRSLSDWAQRSIEHYTYTPYGKRTVDTRWAGNNRSTSPYGNYKSFTGRYLDKETDLYYFRARYYDAEQGRFISRDPAGYVDGMGLYNGYFAMRFKLDPSGLKVEDSEDCPKDCPKDARTRTEKGKTEYRTKEQNEKEIIPNGCGRAGGTQFPEFRGTFTEPCNAHDRCYATCGSSKSACDVTFRNNLRSACDGVRWYLRYICRDGADLYYVGVVLGGKGAYQDAQDEHCVWKECKKSK